MGELVTIANNAYSRNTAYTVKEVAHKDGRTEVVLNGSMILAKAQFKEATGHLPEHTSADRLFLREFNKVLGRQDLD